MSLLTPMHLHVLKPRHFTRYQLELFACIQFQLIHVFKSIVKITRAIYSQLNILKNQLTSGGNVSRVINLYLEANRFYDRNHQMYDAALLTRCYTQHALRPFIDSESNHIRSFIKIPFINKGIDFIDLPSIFLDKSVIQSIPTYFQNSEPPIICYKYNKPIRNTIFNVNKLVSDLDIQVLRL